MAPRVLRSVGRQLGSILEQVSPETPVEIAVIQAKIRSGGAGVRPGAAVAFGDIWRNKRWGSMESVSGRGSERDSARSALEAVNAVIRNHNVERIADAACGDFNWMKDADLANVDYMGFDVVPELVRENNAKFGGERIHFEAGDITLNLFPRVDLIICRDCMIHLPNASIARALANFSLSGSRLMLATSFTGRWHNINIEMGQWRPINLERSPFRLPPPLISFPDPAAGEAFRFSDKILGLWNLK